MLSRIKCGTELPQWSSRQVQAVQRYWQQKLQRLKSTNYICMFIKHRSQRFSLKSRSFIQTEITDCKTYLGIFGGNIISRLNKWVFRHNYRYFVNPCCWGNSKDTFVSVAYYYKVQCLCYHPCSVAIFVAFSASCRLHF